MRGIVVACEVTVAAVEAVAAAAWELVVSVVVWGIVALLRTTDDILVVAIVTDDDVVNSCTWLLSVTSSRGAVLLADVLAGVPLMSSEGRSAATVDIDDDDGTASSADEQERVLHPWSSVGFSVETQARPPTHVTERKWMPPPQLRVHWPHTHSGN